MKIILSDSDLNWSSKAKLHFEQQGIETKVCSTGKDCQLEVYRGGIDCLVLDVDTENYPGLMVMKYMMLNHPAVKVILMIQSKERFKELGLEVTELKKLGASNVLVKPFTEDVLYKTVKGDQYDSWKQLKVNDQPSMEDEKVTLEKDEEFTRIHIENCKSGNITIFDHFIRLGPGRFIKALRKGDSFDAARIKKYINEKKVEYLYFRTKDRATYINFMNDLLKKMANSGKSSGEIISSLKTTTQMYIEEIYTTGIKPQLIDEGKKICQNMYELVQSDKDLARFVRDLQAQDKDGHGHLFLVSFFSTIISKNLDWTSSRTVETIALGGLLHDIGKLKLPAGLRNLSEQEVPEKQKALYRQHPVLGVEMLAKSSIISEPVKQIVYQHHEMVNGTGYPNAFTGPKIYPLAKIVALADGFAEYITTNKLTPIEGLRQFIPDKVATAKYDAMAVKSLVMGLIK